MILIYDSGDVLTSRTLIIVRVWVEIYYQKVFTRLASDHWIKKLCQKQILDYRRYVMMKLSTLIA